MTDAPYLTISAAALRAGVTRQRIHDAIKNGVLPEVPESETPVAGVLLIRTADLDRWRESVRAQPKGGRPRRKKDPDVFV